MKRYIKLMDTLHDEALKMNEVLNDRLRIAFNNFMCGETRYEQMIGRLRRSTPTQQPPRHNERWNEFEKGRLHCVFMAFIADSAMKHGRTEEAIMAKIRKMLPKYY